MVVVAVGVVVGVWVGVGVGIVVGVAVWVGVGIVVGVAVWVGVGVVVVVAVGVVVGVWVGVAVWVVVAVGVAVWVVVAVGVWVGGVTQTQLLRSMFDENGGRLTLGKIMQSYLAASYRQRMTDLKRELFIEGKTIVCYPNHKDGHKSETYWQIEDLPKPTTYVEPSGQLAMVIR